jgi:hypothetical protein
VTTVLSQEDLIALPSSILERLHLKAGQGFEVFVDEEGTITLRRFLRRANHGLVDLLLACPAPFEVPPRGADDCASAQCAPWC